MTTPIRFYLPTDLLWNNSDPGEAERYPTILSRIGPDDTVDTLRDLANRYHIRGDDGTKQPVVPSRSTKPLNNMYGVELIEDEKSGIDVKLGGLCLFDRTEDRKYRLSEEGLKLRSLYLDDDPAWRQWLAQLLGRYFIRLRSFLYYMGSTGCWLTYDGPNMFRGDEALATDEWEYTYAWSGFSYNGAWTIAGLVDVLGDDLPADILREIEQLYDLEYAIVASEFSTFTDALDDIEIIKQRLKDLEESDTPSPETARYICEEVNSLLDEYPESPEAEIRVARVPNLLLEANKDPIIGPFLWEKIEQQADISRDDELDMRFTSMRNQEPLSGNITKVLHYAFRYLYDRGVLVDIEENHEDQKYGLIVDDVQTGAVLPEVADDLIDVEFGTGGTNLLATIHEAYLEDREASGFVTWNDVRQKVCQSRDISEVEFKQEVRELMSRGQMTVVDTQRGLRLDPDGPPGYEEFPHVNLQLQITND